MKFAKKKISVSFAIPFDVLQAFSERVAAENRNASAVVTDALRLYVNAPAPASPSAETKPSKAVSNE